MEDIGKTEIQIIQRQIERGLNSPLTSSMGRLFDAISALLDIRGEIDYEGQAAVELEMTAYKACPESSEGTNYEKGYPYHIAEGKGIRIVKVGDLLSAIVEELRQHTSKARISVKFHNSIAQMVKQMCQLINSETGIKKVALSGGVFQNRLLLNKTVTLLEQNGFQVFTHRQVPCNDGGISLGQAVIANFA